MNTPTIIASAMAEFERLMAQQLHTEVKLINDISRELSQRKGKQLRPMLTLLSAGAAMGHVPDNKIMLAVAMELLHNSSLIHDDVVDESDLRRGRPTLNAMWGNKIAVLFGDFYLANVMSLLCTHADKAEMAIINQTAVEMSEGELLQQENSMNNDLSLAAYRSTIFKKTASLLSACCQIGQYQAGVTSAVDLKRFGYHFGMAFQMRDDLLDYSPNANTGKPYGNDLREHKMTLPLILFMQHASDGERSMVENLLKKKEIDDVEILQVIASAEKNGAIAATREYIRQEVDQALECLASLPESEYKQALVQVAETLLY